MTRFVEFVHSPYFNKHLGVLSLVDYLNKIYPNFTEKNCDRHRILRKVSGKTVQNLRQLAVLFSYTARMLDKFLAIESLEDHDYLLEVHTFKKLRDKKLNDVYLKRYKGIEKNFNSMHSSERKFYFKRYLYADEANEYFTDQFRHTTDNKLVLKQRLLDHFYLTEKLKDLNHQAWRNKALQLDEVSPLSNAVLSYVSSHLEEYNATPHVVVYYHAYVMVSQSDDQSYFKLLEKIEEFENNFNFSELKDLYSSLQNYVIIRVNDGYEPFWQELFNLLRLQLDKKMLHQNQYLIEWHYKNIVSVGLRLEETDWVINFIETNRSELDPKVEENAYSFNLATYHYHVGNFDEVQNLLLHVEYTDIRYSLGAKTLLVQTYYRIQEEEALFSAIEAFKQYVKRNKLISEERKGGYYYFLRFTKRAFVIKSNISLQPSEKTNREIKRLLEQFNSAEAVFYTSWLKEEIDDIVSEVGFEVQS